MSRLLFNLKRAAGYMLGFILFYEPFMLFGQLTSYIFIETSFAAIHVPCAHIPLANIVTGQWQNAGPTSLLFGPLFCGRLCPAGGFSEFLGSILPDKYKIDWPGLVPVLPLRYGFFIGFLFSVWLGFGVPCTYCNYYSLEIFVNLFITGHFLNTLSSLIITFFLANIFFGLFTKGGRGYCLLLCPVGTYNSLFHLLGRFVPATFSMQVRQNKCVGCSRCAQGCPMRAITITNHKAQISRALCIVCGKCAHTCPKRAVRYRSNLTKGADNNERS